MKIETSLYMYLSQREFCVVPLMRAGPTVAKDHRGLPPPRSRRILLPQSPGQSELIYGWLTVCPPHFHSPTITISVGTTHPIPPLSTYVCIRWHIHIILAHVFRVINHSDNWVVADYNSVIRQFTSTLLCFSVAQVVVKKITLYNFQFTGTNPKIASSLIL